ncbi:50S ribosomal protein L14e [Candidatus Woesearchaeota archaeon CG10_big_fil_rev_8_21_14_0_10_30_7]|nr:MAG: 50S ribosomal protein L14e [Candidatus Woesearchaeota archaeon CG10_big_fil_rev_8_21_14_0_10_30_7]
MFEIGRLCVKLAGRDAGKKCVVVEVLEGNYVLIDGETRRRKCNLAHLEPLKEVIKIKAKASHEEITKTLEPLGFKVLNTKPKKASEKPKKKSRVKKQKPVKTGKKVTPKLDVAEKSKAEKPVKSEKPKETKKTTKE